MPKTGKSVNRNITLNEGKFMGWETVLERAKSHLQTNRLQAKRLRSAIRVFQEKLANGEPWPTQSTDHSQDSATQC